MRTRAAECNGSSASVHALSGRMIYRRSTPTPKADSIFAAVRPRTFDGAAGLPPDFAQQGKPCGCPHASTSPRSADWLCDTAARNGSAEKLCRTARLVTKSSPTDRCCDRLRLDASESCRCADTTLSLAITCAETRATAAGARARTGTAAPWSARRNAVRKRCAAQNRLQ